MRGGSVCGGPANKPIFRASSGTTLIGTYAINIDIRFKTAWRDKFIIDLIVVYGMFNRSTSLFLKSYAGSSRIYVSLNTNVIEINSVEQPNLNTVWFGPLLAVLSVVVVLTIVHLFYFCHSFDLCPVSERRKQTTVVVRSHYFDARPTVLRRKQIIVAFRLFGKYVFFTSVFLFIPGCLFPDWNIRFCLSYAHSPRLCVSNYEQC